MAHTGAALDILLVALLVVLFVGAAISDHRQKLRELEKER